MFRFLKHDGAFDFRRFTMERLLQFEKNWTQQARVMTTCQTDFTSWTEQPLLPQETTLLFV